MESFVRANLSKEKFCEKKASRMPSGWLFLPICMPIHLLLFASTRKVSFDIARESAHLTPLSKNIVTTSSRPSRFRLGSNSDPLRVLFPTPSDTAGKSTGFTQRESPKLLN